MDEYTDINQLLAEIKKLRAEKAASVESTEVLKRDCENGDGEGKSEIDETETWVEEPWDVRNLVDSLPKVDNIVAKDNFEILETIENGRETNELDIPANEPADIENKEKENETNDLDIPANETTDIENKVMGSETNDLDIPANEPADIETDEGADEPLGCNIYNIPDGTTFMELAMLFMGSNVVNINLPDKDSPLGHVTFADRTSFLSILGRTDLVIGGRTLDFEADVINDDNISKEKAQPQSMPQPEETTKTKPSVLSDNEAEIGVEAVEASVSSNLDVVKSKLYNTIDLKTISEPVAPNMILSVAKQPHINDSEVPHYPPYVCYAYNVPENQQSPAQLAIIFEAFNVQKFLLPLAGQNCFSIEFKTRNDLLKVCKKNDAVLRSSGIEISLSATVSPKQNDVVTPPVSGNHTINEVEIPHHAPFTCYIWDISPETSDEDIAELLGGLVVLSVKINPKRLSARVQLGKREDMLKLINRNLVLNGSKLRLSLTEGIEPTNTIQPAVRPHGKPIPNLHAGPPAPRFPPTAQPHFPAGSQHPNPQIHQMIPPRRQPHPGSTLPFPQRAAQPQRQNEPSRSKPGGYAPKPLTSKHVVPKPDLRQIPMVPPFVCKFDSLPSNTTNEDISKLLDRLKITKIQFPHNAENSELIRYVEFNERNDLMAVLDAPVLFIKGQVVAVKPVIIEWPPKTGTFPKVSVKPDALKENSSLPNTSQPLSRAIYLYGLPKDVNIAELNAPFSAYKIRALNLPTDSIPYGYIEFEHADHLLLAMQKQNLIIRNAKVLMSVVKLSTVPIATDAMGNNAPTNCIRQSRPQQNRSSPRARDSSADSQMTVASTGSYVKRKWYNKKKTWQPNSQPNLNNISKRVLQAALKENNTAVPNISPIPNDICEPKLDAKVCIKNAKTYSDYDIGHWCRSLGQVSTPIKMQRDPQKNEVIVSLDTQNDAMRLCSALKGIQVEAEIVGGKNDPNSAFFVPNNYFDKLFTGQCVRCAGVSQRTCAKCGRFYCNVECQRIDWPSHSTICTKIPDLVVAAQFLVSQQISTMTFPVQTEIMKSLPPSNTVPALKSNPPVKSVPTFKSAPVAKVQAQALSAIQPSALIHYDAQSQRPKFTQNETVDQVTTKHTPMVRAAIQVPYCDIPKPFSRVVITEVIDVRSVFLRSMDAESQKEHASNEQAIRQFAVNARPLDEEPVPKQVVLAPCNVSGEYLRALLLTKMADKRWAVAFLDRGHMSVVNTDDCRELSGNLQTLRRLVHKCTLALPQNVAIEANDRLKKLRGAHLVIVYTPPFTGSSPIELQVLATKMFVKDMISEHLH